MRYAPPDRARGGFRGHTRGSWLLPELQDVRVQSSQTVDRANGASHARRLDLPPRERLQAVGGSLSDDTCQAAILPRLQSRALALLSLVSAQLTPLDRPSS